MNFTRLLRTLPFLVLAQSSALGQTSFAPATLPVTIRLDSARQIFHLDSVDAMGMKNVPDQHTCIVRQPDGSYQLYIAGVIGTLGTGGGATALLSTKDFLTYSPVVGSSTHAVPVLTPSCPGNPEPYSCSGWVDANYAGANLVWTAINGKDLLMLYYAGNNAITDWAEMALARSTDQGHSWVRMGPVISSADPKPQFPLATGSVLGVVEGGGIVADGYVYAYYAYFPNPDAPDSGRPSIQVARAPLSGDGAPGTWTKYYNGSFGSEPGLGGRGSKIVPDVPGNRRPAQPWPAYSTYLNAYILIFVGSDGWYFSTSNDLVTWSLPVLFYSIKTFQTCEPNDDNVVFVTPGNPGQVIGKTGYAIYAHTPRFGFKTCPTVQFHELWMRPFTFSTSTTDIQAPAGSPLLSFDIEQNYPNPFNPSTTIQFSIASRQRTAVTVFDVLGREVTTLVNEVKEPGTYTVQFDGSNLASGVYFCRLQAGSFAASKRLVLLK